MTAPVSLIDITKCYLVGYCYTCGFPAHIRDAADAVTQIEGQKP